MASRDRAGVAAPPPLIYAIAFGLGYPIRSFFPSYRSIPLAVVLGGFGLTLGLWALTLMVRAHTTVEPYGTTTALVTSGPFRVTRNPLYVSINLFYAALALVTGVTSSLFLLPIANGCMLFLVIKREERYLETKFGDAYRVYRTKVHRWL